MTTSHHTPDNCKIRKHLGTCEICEREPADLIFKTGDITTTFSPQGVRIEVDEIVLTIKYADEAEKLAAAIVKAAQAMRNHAAGIAAVAQALEVQQ